MLDFQREALKVYTSGRYKHFREFVHDDLNLNFFGHEFADFNDIDGHKILSILVNANEESGTQGVMRSQVILYCKHDDISGLAQDQSVRVNGDLYTVKEFHAISNYVWKILLERNE